MSDLGVGDDGRSLHRGQRDLALLVVDRRPSTGGCGVGDPSPLARAGTALSDAEASDPEGWCYGVLGFDVVLPPGGA